MSRSFARFLAVAALAAVLPISAQAQNSCIIVGAGNCTVGVTATMTVPKIAFLNANTTDVTFSMTNPQWQSFIGGVLTDTTLIQQVALNVRANTAYDVDLEATAWSAAWALSDVRWDTQVGACGNGSATTTLVSDQDLVDFAGTATNGAALNLCLGLVVPNDLGSAKLAPGSYTLPLTLRITAP